MAKNGLGKTYPNPMVGCVIVLNNIIIGEGWHQVAGGPHAEVIAINAVKNKSQLKKAVLYVSLEPCSYFGKTPPCANLIVSSGIKEVVIGTIDPNNLVSGKGIAYLRNNGCNVKVGFLQDACFELNKRFFTYHLKKRPFIALKWAQTADGFVDALRELTIDKKPFWISNKFSQQLAHKMRTVEQAILVGNKTVINDDCELTARNWFGQNPIRICIDKDFKIAVTAKILNSKADTIIFTEATIPKQLENSAIYFENIDFSKNVVNQICEKLYQWQIQSVIIEGGPTTIQHFIDINFWDEAVVFESNNYIKKGIKAPIFNLIKPKVIMQLDADTVKIFKNLL